MAVPADVFEPDLIVSSPDGSELALVVEVRLRPTHRAEIERQLKQYMLAMRCPVGLLATPWAIRLYRDEYLSADEESVQLVGEHPSPPDWSVWRVRSDSGRAGAGFEDAVRNWLERLATGGDLESVPQEGRQPVAEFLMPALNQGTIRAARLRKAN